ncbi:MAG: hypothetical protein RBQ97_02635 [Acholeplasma sp.]|nr:hypothetical protein [Acholeplasma sp.]
MRDSKDFNESYMAKFGFFLHKNMGMHVLIVLILNTISLIVTVGLFELIGRPVLNFEIAGFIFFVIVATLIEVSLKIFVLRHFINLIVKTYGFLLIILQVIIFFLSKLIVTEVSFAYMEVLSLIYMTLLFLLIRLVLIIIYQRYIMKKI